MKPFLSAIIIAVVLVLVYFIAVTSLKNKIIAMEEHCENQWAQIDNQLKRRSDLLPNLLNTVKAYAAHEQKAIDAVTSARAKLSMAGSREDRIKAENEIGNSLSQLLVITENYPDLKADANFRQFADELAGTENRIAVARKNYNDAVKVYNVKIRQWPGSTLGLEKKTYYEISSSDKEAPKLEF